MTTGKGEYWARWAQEGQGWQGVFRHIDPALASFAEARQMELRRWHWDAPDRTLTWSSEGLQRNLHVYLDGEHGSYSVLIEGSAWIDQWDNGKGKRYWRSEKLGSVGPLKPIPELDDALGTEVLSCLRSGFQTVQEWSRQKLDQTDALVR